MCISVNTLLLLHAHTAVREGTGRFIEPNRAEPNRAEPNPIESLVFLSVTAVGKAGFKCFQQTECACYRILQSCDVMYGIWCDVHYTILLYSHHYTILLYSQAYSTNNLFIYFYLD